MRLNMNNISEHPVRKTHSAESEASLLAVAAMVGPALFLSSWGGFWTSTILCAAAGAYYAVRINGLQNIKEEPKTYAGSIVATAFLGAVVGVLTGATAQFALRPLVHAII